MPAFIKVDISDHIAVIQLDRPKMNVLNRDMQEEIAEAARGIAGDESVRVVIIHGGQHNFAAGADVKEMVHWDRATATKETPGLQAAFTAVAQIPVPTIAAITGYALGGGCELALACDLRIASTEATLGQPEILLGIIPGAGGTQRLSRLVGTARAKDLILTGRFVGAQEALEIGLVNEVVGTELVLERAFEVARGLARGPRQAMMAAKRAIDHGVALGIEEGLDIEAREFAALFGGKEQVAGMTSFIENGPGKAVFE